MPRRFALLCLLAITATAASAKDVTITLNDEEQKAYFTLLDGALKSGGLANYNVVTRFVIKMQAVLRPELKPQEPKPDEKPVEKN